MSLLRPLETRDPQIAEHLTSAGWIEIYRPDLVEWYAITGSAVTVDVFNASVRVQGLGQLAESLDVNSPLRQAIEAVNPPGPNYGHGQSM